MLYDVNTSPSHFEYSILHQTLYQEDSCQKENLFKQVYAMLLSIAIGDAFGAGIEAKDRDWIKENIDFTCYRDVRINEFRIGYQVGNYTDDTSDSIAVIRTIVSGNFTVDHLYQEIFNEYNNGKKDGIPRAGYGSLGYLWEGKPFPNGVKVDSIEQLREWQKKQKYPGNGPAMRAVPIGLLADETLMNHYAIVNADVSHPHPKARAASVLIARAAHYMIRKNGNPEDLIKYCAKSIKEIDEETYQYLLEVDKLESNFSNEVDFELVVGPQPIKSFMDGSTIYGLNSDAMRTAGTALYLVKHSRSAFEGLKRAIQIGGDVDSLAAIVVGILGGRYGIQDFPDFLIRDVEGIDYLEKMAQQYTDFLFDEDSR